MKRSKSIEAKPAIKKSKANSYSKPDDSTNKVIKQKMGKKTSFNKSLTPTKESNLKKGIVSDSNNENKPGLSEEKKKLIKSQFGKKGKINKYNKFLNKKGKKTPHELDKLLDKDGKPKWGEYKEQKRKLKEQRKVRRSGTDQHKLSVAAKAIWEKLRECTARAKRKKEQGQKENNNDKEEKETLVNELFDLLKGQIPNVAIPVLELMYSTFASVEQRRQMHVELYGEMCALLPAEVSRIEDIPADMKPAITAATKANVIKLLTKKQLLHTTYFQSILNDYLTSCSAQDCNDILELIQGDVLEFLNSKEGKRVALRIIWLATNKMKKVIVKSMKTKVKEIALNEEGYMMLLALFDSVDDTVLVNKALVSELLKDIKEIVSNESGRKVVLYLVAHRDPAYFHPQVIDILSKGDAISTRKKDSEVRKQELLDNISKPLLEKITLDPATWLGDSSLAMVSLAIMKSGKGEPLKKAFESVVSYMLDTNSVLEVKNRKFHAIEHSALHLVFKKLIQIDDTDQPSESFSSVLVSRLSEENLNHILHFNRGCFLLVLLLESNNKKMCKMLKSKITESMYSFLRNQETTGSKILLKKLSGE